MTDKTTDPWTGVQGDVDPAKYYLAAQDKHGHSKSVPAEVPKDVHRAFMAMVYDESTDYRSLADGVRDAMVQLLGLRKRQGRLGDEANKAITVALEQEKIRQSVAEYEVTSNMIDEIEMALKVAKSSGESQKLKNIIEIVEGTLDNYPLAQRVNLEQMLDVARRILKDMVRSLNKAQGISEEGGQASAST